MAAQWRPLANAKSSGNANRLVCENIKMKNYPSIPWLIRVARFGDAPIYIHLFSLVCLPMFWGAASFPIAVWGTVLIILLVLIHEIGHALVCRLVGAEVNFLLVGMLFGYCDYTHWGEQPDERDFVLIAWGGVFAQLVLLIVALLGFALLADSSIFMPNYFRPDGSSFAHMTWLVLVAFNAAIIISNLIPIHPLDGYKAWEMSPWRAVRAMWYGWKVQQDRKQAGKN